ncbi:hypothetical protein [Halomicrobium salinisoli]|uniref:hypothetical protein n=1 Tax=Halomicrobium salinisoli TaxID=2878391 RepID=UPI001CF002DA|nr:hypothetical protein [Halomicrobium salinisoli]
MSESPSNSSAEDLSDLFVSVTGDDSVTERQEEDQTDREVAEEEEIDVDDGLEDAVEGAEIGTVGDPSA